MDLSNLNIKNLDHLGLVAGLCQEVGIAQIIDNLFPSSANDKIISTGKSLKAMILNGLGFTAEILLAKGYSCDYRPELNQVILNLITENQAGIPVYMKAHWRWVYSSIYAQTTAKS